MALKLVSSWRRVGFGSWFRVGEELGSEVGFVLGKSWVQKKKNVYTYILC